MSRGLELYLFDSGTLTSGGVEAPVPFFLLRHPDGDVLVDGGNPLAVARDARAHWGPLADSFEVHMTEDQHCVVQLSALGLAPSAVRYVVQTHLHMDHTGALGHFPEATVVVHERELEAARAAESPGASGYVRADFDRPELRWRPTHGDLDLFDDGAIQLIETPGHSPGHLSLVLALEETGTVLLTGDAVDNRAQWEGQQRLRALFSREQAARSLERLRELDDQTGALTIPGHDAGEWRRLKRAPEHYA